MKSILKLVLGFFLISSLFVSCKKDIDTTETNEFKKVADYDYKIVHEWNDLWLEVERVASGYRPCPTANALGYVGLANYEATVSGMSDYQSIASNYGGLTIPKTFSNQEYHWPTVINAVNNYMYNRLFPEVKNEVYSKIKVLSDKNEKLFLQQTSQETFLRSKNHGEAVATAVWEWMKTDAVTFDGYKDPFKENNWQDRLDEPGAWTPTQPGPGNGMFAYWGKGRTLAIKDDMRICKPYTEYVGNFSEEKGKGIYNQALEVMSQNVSELAYQTEWVGEFWSDDLLGLTFSPPSRWIAIADQVYANEDANLEEAVVCNAKIGVALHDAAIGCWNSKYYYNIERPESYIKRVIDPTFEPNLFNPLSGEGGISPSFPAYPSGHSTFGAASAEVIASIFGYSYSMTDNCHKNRTEFSGYPRTFNSFYEMANEIAWSRVPLGVHFRMDAEEGMRYGTEIGRIVNRLPWKK
ncbi:MAG: vanadium-dependent haloperoxidase [Saprospiraceae bacterium]|nr:vanadium-dependent haloperoxidase [Saprospiraceae bacterium]MBP9055124.1 vanadium-dependent haloperoxidase [Saprospiraceae bacterium]HRG39871.1 vanadium-dependent haloperoxidase [Saprospiraceae bacterium]